MKIGTYQTPFFSTYTLDQFISNRIMKNRKAEDIYVVDLMVKHKETATIKKERLILFFLNSSFLSTVFIQFFLETSLYLILRPIIYVVFALTLLLVINSKSNLNSNSFLSLYSVFIYFTILFALLISFFKSEFPTSTILAFLLPYFIIYLGFKINISEKQLSKMILHYMNLVTLLGLFILFHYGNGFHITEQYFFSSKNQVGPLIGSVALLALITLLNKNNNKISINKVWLFVLFVVNFSSIIVIRNRSGLVALGVCLVVFLLSKIKIKKRFNKTILLTPIMLLVLGISVSSNILSPIYDVIYRTLFMNYNVSDLNSLSANRTDTYGSVLQFLKVSPFFGEQLVNSDIFETPHNYLLNLWLRFGIFGMLPITIFYIALWVFVLFQTVVVKKFDISFYLILFALVISFFEYSFPFGPLTTVTVTWFLFGHYLKKTGVSSS
jgi:O-antigen ligase